MQVYGKMIHGSDRKAMQQCTRSIETCYLIKKRGKISSKVHHKGGKWHHKSFESNAVSAAAGATFLLQTKRVPNATPASNATHQTDSSSSLRLIIRPRLRCHLATARRRRGQRRQICYHCAKGAPANDCEWSQNEPMSTARVGFPTASQIASNEATSPASLPGRSSKEETRKSAPHGRRGIELAPEKKQLS